MLAIDCLPVRGGTRSYRGRLDKYT
jgi:hypothetical protein